MFWKASFLSMEATKQHLPSPQPLEKEAVENRNCFLRTKLHITFLSSLLKKVSLMGAAVRESDHQLCNEFPLIIRGNDGTFILVCNFFL